jgi:hypothetical protein
MSSLDVSEKLRPHRKRLVLAARDVLKRWQSRLPDKAQFARLVNVCTEASCSEEIELYLRYQGSRQNAPWKDLELVNLVIGGFDAVAPASAGWSDEERVEGWRLFATFLAREFTYVDVARKQQRHDNQGHAGTSALRGGDRGAKAGRPGPQGRRS